MEIVYGALFAVGIVLLLVSFIFGEFGTDHDGIMLLSPLSIAAGLVAGGATGLVCTLLHLFVLASIPAIVAGVLVYGATYALKKAFMKQGVDMHYSQASYLNSKAIVIDSSIAVGDWGVVAFKDVNGARVESKAYNTHTASLPAGSEVVIHTIENGALYVAPFGS